MSSFQKKKDTCFVFNVNYSSTSKTQVWAPSLDPIKMVNLLTVHTQFTQAYVKTAVEEHCKLYDAFDCSNDHSACYALLDSLDISFKQYIRDHLHDDFYLLIIWMQVIKALQRNSLKHFKAMKCELENIKPQQYPGQNVTDMSLDVTYIAKLSPQLVSGSTSCAQASLRMAMNYTATLLLLWRLPWKMNSYG